VTQDEHAARLAQQSEMGQVGNERSYHKLTMVPFLEIRRVSLTRGGSLKDVFSLDDQMIGMTSISRKASNPDETHGWLSDPVPTISWLVRW